MSLLLPTGLTKFAFELKHRALPVQTSLVSCHRRYW
jgi:hypothetical protein